MDNIKLRPAAVAAFNAFAEALSGEPEIRRLTALVDRHARIAAEARLLIHNGGAGPNNAQLRRVDYILKEIAGLPRA